MQPVNLIVASSANPSLFGSALTLLAAVVPASSTTIYPTGDVVFVIDGVASQSAPIVDGAASVDVSWLGLAVGSYNVVAYYLGDAEFQPGTSGAMTQVVAAAPAPQSCPAGAINVTKHGVIGDGATDNQAALQALINLTGLAVTHQNVTAPCVFYFPDGTYLVSGTLDFSSMQAFGILGEVDALGQPASIIKGTAASGSLVNINNGRSHNFNVKNVQLEGGAGQTAFYSYYAVMSSFENCWFGGHVGLTLSGGFSEALRSVKFIGSGATNTGSIGLLADKPTNSIVSDCDFRGWDQGIRAAGTGLSVIRSSFEKCGTGLMLGMDTNGNGYSMLRSSFRSLTFTDCDVGMFFLNLGGGNYFSDINIVGTASAPSGQSKYGIAGGYVVYSAFSDVHVGGGFSGAAINIAASPLNLYTIWQNTTFYSSTATNSIPGGLAWNVKPDAVSPAALAKGHVQVVIDNTNVLPEPVNIDDVTASGYVAAPLSVVNVTQYGVVGNGTTDNAAKLQSLINSAQPGTTFYFPTGTYNVSATIDFSRLSAFSLIGDLATSGGTAGMTIIQGSVAGPILKADYGAQAGTFRIRNLVVRNNSRDVSSSGLFTRNSVLSSIQDISIGGYVGMHHENPFMLSMRSVSLANYGADYIGLLVNGGMRSTIENVRGGGLQEAIRIGGCTDFAVFVGDIETDQTAINVGLDAAGAVSQMTGLSLQGLGFEGNNIAIDLKNCSNVFLAGSGASGHADPGIVSTSGLVIEDGVHDCTFAAAAVGGYFVVGPAVKVTSGAANLLFTDFQANNVQPGMATWDIESTNNIVLNSTGQ